MADRPKITSLKPRIATLNTSHVKTLPANAGMVQRLRGSAGVKDRHSIRARDNGLCVACLAMDRVTIGRVVDHIVPLWNNGTDDASNKQTLCFSCHDQKTKQETKQRQGGY